jgi:hypothetical protein
MNKPLKFLQVFPNGNEVYVTVSGSTALYFVFVPTKKKQFGPYFTSEEAREFAKLSKS